MKKIVTILTLVSIMAIFMMGSVYAALSCNVNMQSNKTEVNKNGEFTVNVNISNIQSDNGVISMGGTLQYDKDSLELVSFEGKNGWETPSEGTSFNSATGKIAITRNGLGKNAETIFSMTFKVKENSKQNLTILLNDVYVADGTLPMAKIASISQNITVSEGTPNPDPTPNPGGNGSGNSNGGSTTGGNSSSDSKTKNTVDKKITTNSTLPKAGNDTIVFITLISVFILVAVIFFIRMKYINQKLK